jgi:PAS domain S-box-containing protein
MNTDSPATELRPTGISVIGDVRWGTHFCYFYETKQELLETLVLYFKTGLEYKEFCLWVVSQPLTVEEAKRALGQAVSDLDRHLAEGSLEIHAQDEWYLHNGQCEPERVIQSWREQLNEALTRGYAGMRASGDTARVQKDQWRVFREYDALSADQRMIVLYTYPLTSPAAQIFDVARLHQVAVAQRHGSWEIVETPELKQAKAEIKRLIDELEQKVEERTRELATTVEALKQAEDRIRLVIDTIPTMAWSLRPDGAVDFVNQRWMDYTGLSLEEALEDSKRIVHPEDLPRAVEKWLPNMAAGNPGEDEMRLRRADGEYRWFLVRTAPLLDERGNIVRWYGTSTDIEDHRRAEEALNAQALRYKTLMETSTDSIYVLNEKGDLQEANAAFLHRRGYSTAEGKGLNIADWDAQWSREQLQENLRKLVGSSAVFETRHRCKDGSVFDVEVCATSVRIGGEQLFFCVTRDITERKQAETQSRVLIDAIPHQIWSGPPDGTLDYCNERWRSYMGLEMEDARGEGWQTVLHPKDRDRVLKAWHESVAHGTPYEQEERHRAADGTYRWFLSRGVPLRDAEGRIARWYGTNTDIEDRKRAEQMLRDSREQLRELAARLESLREDERMRISREIHDDLGQKLTGLRMDLLWAERKLGELGNSSAINTLLDRVVSATELVDEMIVAVQEIAAELRPGVLDKLGLGSALQYAARRFEERTGIPCRVRLPETEPALPPELSTALFRILQECLTNIVRHAIATKLEVELKVEDGWVTMSVQDNGRGITEAELANVRSLGLLGMKERAALLGGEVTIQRGADRGTIVTARLPQTQMSVRAGTRYDSHSHCG